VVPFAIAAVAVVVLWTLAIAHERTKLIFFRYVRDWVTLTFTLVAYREMDWFTPKYQDHHLEQQWMMWDRVVLHDWGLQRMIESTGLMLPALLEFSYLLVYAVGPFTVAMLYVFHRGRLSGRVLFTYVLGTVMAYGLFPYFPSSPPRVVFPDADPPGITSAFRSLNLFLVGDYGIHSSVFPSAHVSSAFSAAWAMLLFLPDRKWLWRGMLLYAITVSIATVYGRYHYSVDALAGFGVSLAAAAITIVTLRPQKVLSQLR
jgi:membrane-associated phospholipid phosphatase